MVNSNLAATSLQNAKPGEIISFGNYQQTAEPSDKTPIKWHVLQNSVEELFILSEHILDCKRYHGEFTDITWVDCDLRKWLNDEFFNAAFSNSEKDIINTTPCTGNGENSRDTDDKVFLLSVDEVKNLTDIPGKNGFAVKRRALGTEFAKLKKADGCHLYVYDGSGENNYIVENGKKYGCSWWWSRTQLGSLSRATFIGPRSSIRSYGRINRFRYGVRPALKLNLLAS